MSCLRKAPGITAHLPPNSGLRISDGITGITLSLTIARWPKRLQQAVADLVHVYQFRDRDRICCHDVSVTQCYALETVVEHGPMRLSTLAERLFVIGRFLRRGPWDFPVIQAGNGAHDVTFEACSGFTRVAARRLADPPMVGRCLKRGSAGRLPFPPRQLLRFTDNFQSRTFTCNCHGTFSRRSE